MPPSQLKRLKSSLREHGVVGPQKSKKQKRQATKSGSFNDGKIQRNAALQHIRDQFNPFEIKGPARSKYEFTNNKTIGGRVTKGMVGRPGVTKGLGEEKRRQTLLVEMQRRSKVGGILDRRFGENDPTMTPEQKALERFVKEKQKADKKGALFDLEDGEEEDQLTHFGQSLAFDKSEHIALKGAHVKSQGSFSPDGGEDLRPVKKRKVSVEISSEDDSFGASFKQHPERPMTKKEVMSEVIAKAKLHKYERQKAKEDDDDLRAELDKGLPDLFAMLRGTSHPSVPAPAHTADPNGFMNPDRAALLNGNEKSQNDRDYDERLRQMVFDQRSKPTERTLTEEEKLHLHAQKLKDLEEKRLRRMKGEHEDSLGEDDEREQDLNVDEDLHADEDDIFGLGSGIPEPMQARDIGVEDEDDFIIEDNLVGSGSELATDDELNENSSASSFDEYDDQEFVQGLLSTDDIGRAGLAPGKTSTDTEPLKGNALAFTYPCPQNHEDLLRITENISLEDLPTVVQRIRALYHPKLHSENKAKLANFSSILVEHVFYLSNLSQHPPFAVLETLIRHIHSLAKTFSDQVGCAFRAHLNTFHKNRPTAPTSGDLVLLTAIASIFPPSDHFHQIVTPANLCMTRYLSQKIPNTLSDLVIGTYLGTLCLQYQNLSKRYIPELVNYVLQALLILAPAKMKAIPGSFPYAASETSLHIEGRLRKSDQVIRRLRFWDSICVSDLSDNSKEELKLALLHGLLALIDNMADLWANKSAFFEAFDPVAKTLLTRTLQTLQTQLHSSLLTRRALTLHNHRPLAIKTSIPKFEESYNPERHYDPDRDRAVSSKLKAEYKKERKGALRELRKDASFMAREGLKLKRERDAEYERKYKRLVAEIQGEEGREAKVYEREKRMRKAKGRR